MTNILPTTQQPELVFAVSPAPKVSADEVQTLCRLLRGQGWRTAAEIGALVTLPGTSMAAAERPWNDRKIRAIAEASDGAVVSYPGSPGYILFDEASQAEIAHAVSAMQSQGKRMLARALALDRRDRQRRLVDRPQPQP